MSESLKYLKQSEIKTVKADILEKQGFRCAICGKPLELSEAVLDHQHKFKKADANGENGNGLIRGVLCNFCNPAEGKCFNAMSRYIQARTDEDRIQWLENLISYYRQPKYPLVHPTEVPREPDISKRNFNKLKKAYEKANPGKKPLEYPKSGKLTKPLKALFEKFEISPYNSVDSL
jgi:hypothetical protein